MAAKTQGSYDEQLKAALMALDSGDTETAFRALNPVIAYPGLLDSDERWMEAWETFAQIAERVIGAELAGVVRQGAFEMSNLQALFDLGYVLIEQELHAPAATVLHRANVLYPGHPDLVCELVFALGEIGANADALQRLREVAHLADSEFSVRYLMAFQHLMMADVEAAKHLLPLLRAMASAEGEADMTGRLDGMIRRADAIATITSLDTDDLRGWHFAITGGILAHLSPFGADVMRGRYAYLQDSYALIHEGIRRLAAILDAAKISAPRVFLLPDRDSRILAAATAAMLELPLAEWPDALGEEWVDESARGIVPIYDSTFLPAELLQQLRVHRPGQLVWVHAGQWTPEPPFAPDVVTFLHQFCIPPWGEQAYLDPDSNEMKQRPADGSPVESLAQRVTAAEMDEDALGDLDTLREFAKVAAEMAGDGVGINRASGLRERHWSQSPVVSKRFV